MRYVQTVYLAGDSRAAAKLLRRLLLMKSEKAYPFSGGYAFLFLSDSARLRYEVRKRNSLLFFRYPLHFSP